MYNVQKTDTVQETSVKHGVCQIQISVEKVNQIGRS